MPAHVQRLKQACIGIVMLLSLACALPAGAQNTEQSPGRKAQQDFADAIAGAIMREVYTDKALVEEFGSFLKKEAADRKWDACFTEHVRVLDLIKAKQKAEQSLAQAVAVLQTVQSYASNAEKRYNDVVAKFEGMTGADADYYLRSTVDPIRAGWQKAKDVVAGAQAQVNQAREALKGIDQRYPTDLQAIFQDAGAPYPGAADIPVDQLAEIIKKRDDPLGRKCLRLAIWYGRGLQLSEQRVSADTANEGPPSDTTDIAAACEAAISACDFKTARSIIEGIPTGEDRDRLIGLYRAVVARERQTRALWERAVDLFRQGKKDEARGAFEQARANTQCTQYRGRIDSALSKVTGDQTAGGPPLDDPHWRASWKGGLKTERLTVNGQDIEASAFFQMLDADWSREKARAERERQSGGGVLSGIFSGFTEEMGKIVVGFSKLFIGMMDDGIRWSFALKPEGPGLRLVVEGDDKAAAEMNKSLGALPLFVSNGERRLKLSYQRAPGEAQYAIDFAVDDTWSSATIDIVAGGAWPQGSSEPGRLIRTLEWKISGRFEPGIIPAAELQSELQQKIDSAKPLYAPELGASR